ncbi:MAG: hypothetical protein NTV01_12970 [Bacteroidia bacterium]|nr:hypothetical protein [Bacteroidia bacterium]
MFKRCKVSLLFITWCLITASHAQAVPVDTLKFGAFGKIAIYKPAGDPKAVILFVSGDGGWNSGVVDMARDFVAQGAMVAGIDILTYYRGLKTLSADCYYPAADFEELSMMLQKKYKIGPGMPFPGNKAVHERSEHRAADRIAKGRTWILGGFKLAAPVC